MANPEDTGQFENWVTNRQCSTVVSGKIGDTGDFEGWFTDRLYWKWYVKQKQPLLSVLWRCLTGVGL